MNEQSDQHDVREADPPAGDLDCDAATTLFDVSPFVLALVDPAAYQPASPECDILGAKGNSDGLVDNCEIYPFVELLTGK